MLLHLGFLCSILFSGALSAPNETYSSDTGVIYSPNYPNNYDNNLRYFITINVQPGYYVYITLLDFETEPCCDKLYIWDGSDVTKQTIANISGTQTGSFYSSTGSSMTLMFGTDPIDTYRGFAIKYEQVPVNTKVQMTNQCAPNIQTLAAGFITSPNWPANYPNNVSCSYKLSSTKAKVMLQFAAFSTEGCCDKVYIYDGSGINAPTIAVISGSSLSNTTFYSSGPAMFVQFTSDFTNNDAGFSAYYVSVS